MGVECLDRDVSQIHATQQREDRVFSGDEWVEVHIDPPHRHRGKCPFFTNPLGTKADANEGPSGQFNYGWSADWDCAARIGTDRWTFEMRIPLKVMNCFRTDGQPRRDIFGPSFRGTHHVKAGEGWYKELTFSCSPQVYFNQDGDNTLRDYGLYASGILRNDATCEVRGPGRQGRAALRFRKRHASVAGG